MPLKLTLPAYCQRGSVDALITLVSLVSFELLLANTILKMAL
jgi:hypothetical protein